MNNTQLINTGLQLSQQITVPKPIMVSETAVAQNCPPPSTKLTATQIAERNILRLFRKIEAGFGKSELAGLCFVLGRRVSVEQYGEPRVVIIYRSIRGKPA